MSVYSEDIDSAKKTLPEGDYTFVEGVGAIPRDIYKYVKSDPLGDLPRYSVHIVIQHFLIFLSFLTLASTGLPLHFSDLWWASYVISLFGGSDSARLIHRIAALVMVLACVYHLFTIILGTIHKILNKQFDIKRTQIPRLKDLKDLIHDIKYFLGIEPYRPKMEKFMYKQKFHYFAILWGSFVMITAGSTLLFPETMANVWPNPRFFQDLARLMHADEAIMAMTVVVFWHWTNVHLVPGRFPLQWTFITGKITREHQIEEHFLEYVNYNLKEIPEEREYMKKLLKEKGFDTINLSESAGSKGGDL
jgi:cytochrome b subunit of formate dehydrogenase